MKVEILCSGNIEEILNEEEVQYKVTYSGDRYKVLELEKENAKDLNNRNFENVWCRFSKGMGGSLYDMIDVHGDSLIGWTPKKSTSYKKLTDYLSALDVNDNDEVCDFAVGLAKANGLSLSKLFMLYEG